MSDTSDIDDEDLLRLQMAKALGVDPEEIEIDESPLASFGVGDAKKISIGGKKEWTVVASDDVARDIALAVVKQDLESEPEMFDKNFLQSHINIDRLRNDLHGDVYDSNYERLKEDAERKPEKFLKANDLDWPEPTDKQIREYAEADSDDDDPAQIDAKIAEIKAMGDAEDRWIELGEEPEVPDSDIESVAEAETDEQLKDPMSYLEDIHGKEDAAKEAIKIAGIDAAAAIEDAVDTDGWQHFLSRYDGNSYDTPAGFVWWREN